MPNGTDCYISVKVDPEKCKISCKGLFADVFKEKRLKRVKDRKTLQRMLASYENYKVGKGLKKESSTSIGGEFP